MLAFEYLTTRPRRFRLARAFSLFPNGLDFWLGLPHSSPFVPRRYIARVAFKRSWAAFHSLSEIIRSCGMGI